MWALTVSVHASCPLPLPQPARSLHSCWLSLPLCPSHMPRSCQPSKLSSSGIFSEFLSAPTEILPLIKPSPRASPHHSVLSSFSSPLICFPLLFCTYWVQRTLESQLQTLSRLYTLYSFVCGINLPSLSAAARCRPRGWPCLLLILYTSPPPCFTHRHTHSPS